MLLKPRQPFHFAHTLRFILSPPTPPDGRQASPLVDYFEAGEYRRAVEIDGQPVLYGVSEERRGASSGLRLRILAGPQGAKLTRFVGVLVERQFSSSLDLTPFYRLIQTDPVMRKLAAHFRGARIPQSPAVYEALISAILEQQVNVTFAHHVKKALIEAYGKPIEYEGRPYHCFPEPAQLAITTPSELRQIQISGPKARYLIGISRLTLDGTLDLEGLRAVEPSLAYERLLGSKGVGPWTAQYVGLRALGHLDCLPAADVGLQKAIQHYYGLRKQPPPARVEKLARAWEGWRSYATFYLWLTYWEDAAWRKAFKEEIRDEQRRQEFSRAL